MKKRELTRILKQYNDDDEVVMLFGSPNDYMRTEHVVGVGEVFIKEKRAIVLYDKSSFELEDSELGD